MSGIMSGSTICAVWVSELAETVNEDQLYEFLNYTLDKKQITSFPLQLRC